MLFERGIGLTAIIRAAALGKLTRDPEKRAHQVDEFVARGALDPSVRSA